MDIVANAHRFWEIVEKSLVELYGFDPVVAHARVLALQGRMTPAAIVRRVTYHSQPLHVAHDIAQNMEPISKATLSKYGKIVAQIDSKPSDRSCDAAPESVFTEQDVAILELSGLPVP